MVYRAVEKCDKFRFSMDMCSIHRENSTGLNDTFLKVASVFISCCLRPNQGNLLLFSILHMLQTMVVCLMLDCIMLGTCPKSSAHIIVLLYSDVSFKLSPVSSYCMI